MSSSKVTTKEIIETTERYPVQQEEYVRTFGGVKTMSIPFTARTKKVLVKHHYFRESYEEEQCKQLEDHHTTYTPFSPKTRNHRRNNYIDTLSSSNEHHSLRSQRNNLISSYILKSSTPERSYNVVTARTNVNRSKQKYNNNKYQIINPFKKNERYVEEYYPSQRAVTLSSEYHHSCHHNKQNETVYIYSSELEGTPEHIETNPEYVAENIHILTNNNYDDDAYKRDCIVFIQSCYRGHLTRKSLYDNLRYFYRIHSASEIIKGVFDKHNQRLFYKKANKYVVYLNSVYLKKIVRIDVNNLPQYYKRNVKYTLLRKDKGDAFQVIRKKIGTGDNSGSNCYCSEIHNITYNVSTDEQQQKDKVYKMKLQNKILKQLLIMKLQKEENNLRERFLKFKGTDKERYDALLKRNKEQQLRNLLKKKIDKKENELKRNFAKFFYLGVMREMTMTQEEREALQTQKKLKHLVNNKTLKENNNDKSKAFKQFYLNGLVKELKKAVDKTKEQQEHINQQSKTIEELRNSIQQQINEKETAPTQTQQLIPQEELDKIKQRKVKKLINNKIKDDNKFLHDQFVKFYYNGLYKYMVHDKPKEDMLKLQQLQQELNEVKEQQQQQQQTAAMPPQQQQQPQYDKLVPKKSLEIEIPADNTNTNVLSPQQQQNEGTTSSKNKAKELRKLIRNRAKMNREKLRKYFDKLYTNGIIRSLKNAPKTLSQTNTPVNKEQIVYISSSQPQQQKTEQQLEEERIENEKAQKAKEREDNIRKRLDKIVYQIDRNNLLVSKSMFSKWNLRTKLLRLKEVKGKKKKKKSVSPTNKKSTALPKVNAVKLRTLTPLAKNTPMIVEEDNNNDNDNNNNEIVIGPFEVNEETSEVVKPLRSRARAPRVDNDNDNEEEGVNTNDIEHLKYLLEEYEEEEDDDEDEDVYEGENEIEMPVINEAPELQGINSIEVPSQQITNKNVPIKKVLTSPITSTNNVASSTTTPSGTSANIQKPTRSKAPIKLRANKKQSATIKPVTEDTQIQTDPFEFISNLITKNGSNVHKLPQSIQSSSLSYIAANTTNEGNVQLPKDVEELEKKELIALFTFGFLCSFFLLFQQG